MADDRSAAAIYLRKDKQVEARNAAKTAAAAIPFAGILIAGSVDLSNAEQVNARALADRIEQLQFLLKRKGCTQ